MPLPAFHVAGFVQVGAPLSGSVTLCTLGPLTNIATAFRKAPDIVPRIRELVMMGGGFFEGGNTTPAAEFNIYVDPHAAHVVMTSGIKLTMVPLDDGLHNRQTETEPMWLRGVEGFENALAVLRGDSGPRVADCDKQARPVGTGAYNQRVNFHASASADHQR